MTSTINLNEQPIRFAGSELGKNSHICGFFSNREEEYQLLLPFIKDGFACRDKAFHVVSPRLLDDHVQRLESVGIDVEGVEKSGQLELCDWEKAYLPDGRFDQDRMLAMWQEVMGEAVQSGYSRTRLIAHMEWALEDREGVSDLIEYEARFNLIHDARDPVICAYDLRKFTGDVIMDILRTHPTMLVGGVLMENPFFISPDQFLKDIRDRRANSAKSRPIAN